MGYHSQRQLCALFMVMIKVNTLTESWLNHVLNHVLLAKFNKCSVVNYCNFILISSLLKGKSTLVKKSRDEFRIWGGKTLPC